MVATIAVALAVVVRSRRASALKEAAAAASDDNDGDDPMAVEALDGSPMKVVPVVPTTNSRAVFRPVASRLRMDAGVLYPDHSVRPGAAPSDDGFEC